jgi:hypothetical protein
VQNPGKMPQKVQKLYVLVSDSLMQVSFAGFLSLPALYVVACGVVSVLGPLLLVLIMRCVQ